MPAQASERRRHATTSRRSWASARPFEFPEPEAGHASPWQDPVALADRRRRSWTRPLTLRAVAGDAIISFTVTAAITATLPQFRLGAIEAGLLGALIWVFAVAVSRGYEAGRLGDGAEEFQAVLRAAAGVIAGVGVVSYAMHYLLPRREVLLAVPLTALLSACYRHALRQRLHRRRYRGDAMLRTLVVGEPVAVDRLTQDLQSKASHGFEVVGACVPEPGPEIAENLGVELMGILSDVPQVVVDNKIDAVIVVGSQLSGQGLRRLSWALERTGAGLLVEPGLVEVTGPNVSLRPAAGLSLLQLEPPSSRHGRMLGKAVLDRTLGTLMLLVATPVIVLSALASG